jgi:hypothetical protein
MKKPSEPLGFFVRSLVARRCGKEAVSDDGRSEKAAAVLDADFNAWEPLGGARLKRSEMPERIASLSRSQLIGGVMATGALAACGGGVNTPVVSPGSATIAPNCVTASSFGVNDIFCAPVFKGLDKATLAALFDPSPKINANRHVRRSRLRAAT